MFHWNYFLLDYVYLQHYNVSFYFIPGTQGALRKKAATWCRANLEHSRRSLSPKQKVLNGIPRGLEQDCQGCKCSWLHGRKPEGKVYGKERSLSFWKAEINLLQFSFCDDRLQQSFWLKTTFLFFLLELQSSLFQPTLLLSSYTEEWRNYQCL